jgi:hypothetical protein
MSMASAVAARPSCREPSANGFEGRRVGGGQPTEDLGGIGGSLQRLLPPTLVGQVDAEIGQRPREIRLVRLRSGRGQPPVDLDGLGGDAQGLLPASHGGEVGAENGQRPGEFGLVGLRRGGSEPAEHVDGVGDGR